MKFHLNLLLNVFSFKVFKPKKFLFKNAIFLSVQYTPKTLTAKFLQDFLYMKCMFINVVQNQNKEKRFHLYNHNHKEYNKSILASITKNNLNLNDLSNLHLIQ